MHAFREQTIGTFLDALASDAPAPGGGAAAGLAGAMGAALISMVTNLTIGRKKYADVEEEMKAIREQAEAIRVELTALAELDAQVFERVMEAYRLPRETDEQKAARKQAIREALKEATEVPLRMAEQAARLFELAVPLAEKGNKNAISDAGAGVQLANAAFETALLNVAINLSLLDDEAFAAQVRERVEALRAVQAECKDKAVETVYRRIQG
ncbi:MAG: methenyltetrahydrofolate cyclohydrolase [Ardenticatenia bacterium]|nr:MAG: methenyltetrahydrofolate cyclohydrolase [Ardenticatenia bacterium]